MTKLYEKSWWDTYPKENALYTILFENFGSRGTALSFPARPAHCQLPKPNCSAQTAGITAEIVLGAQRAENSLSNWLFSVKSQQNTGISQVNIVF